MTRFAWLFALTGCGVAVTVPSQQPAAAKPPDHPIKAAPLTYFKQNCAHCHGPEGGAYGDTFYQRRDLEALSKEVKAMCDGPGQSPLEGGDLDAQTAYHQAMIARAPFIAWTGQNDGTITGEFTRDADLVAEVAGSKVDVEVKGIKWSLKLAAGQAVKDVRLTATLDHVDSVLDLSKSATSLPSVWPPKPNK